MKAGTSALRFIYGISFLADYIGQRVVEVCITEGKTQIRRTHRQRALAAEEQCVGHFSERETQGYVRHRLKVAGATAASVLLWRWEGELTALGVDEVIPVTASPEEFLAGIRSLLVHARSGTGDGELEVLQR